MSLQALLDEIEVLKQEYEKFERGNKSAGTRARKSLQNVKKIAQDLRVQIQKDPRYADFPSRAEVREILGLRLPVASLTDVLQGKIWAAMDEMRRPSKRQKDLADIARLLEAHPHLRSSIPQEVLAKLV